MDFSQLPKMSKTPTPPAPAEVEPTRPPVTPAVQPAYSAATYGAAPANPLVSIWVSLIVGLICLMLGWNFARWLGGKMSGHEMPTGIVWSPGSGREGQPVTFFELQGGTAWTDTGFFAMGVALLLDAALIGVAARKPIPNRGLVLAALVATAISLLINVGVAGYMFNLGFMPLPSMVLILVAGFVLFDQLPLLRARH